MLTDKEFQILRLRAEGLKQTQIADRLGITQGAVSRFEGRARAKIADAVQDLALLEELGIAYEGSAIGIQERADLLRRDR